MAQNAMYDFVVNDEDEVMLLLYAGNTEPQNARFVIDLDNNYLNRVGLELTTYNKKGIRKLENIPYSLFAISLLIMSLA